VKEEAMTQQLHADTDIPLVKLVDSGLTLEDDRQDIRGRSVIDQDGKTVGHVRALFIDSAERKVRMLDIAGGGFLGMGDQHFLLPVDAITKVNKADVHVNETAHRIHHSPIYNPELVTSYRRDYWEPYYGYYGGSPYWSAGYRYPDYGNWYY
jgi:sporulation protein YlmC with PRC-barrel domain